MLEVLAQKSNKQQQFKFVEVNEPCGYFRGQQQRMNELKIGGITMYLGHKRCR